MALYNKWDVKNGFLYVLQFLSLISDGLGGVVCYHTYLLDVLWGQPIKLAKVASTSELHENQWNDLLFFEIVPSHCFGASEVQT